MRMLMISYEFDCSPVKIYPSPIHHISKIEIDGEVGEVPINGWVRNKDFTIDFGSFNKLKIDVWFGFQCRDNACYRSGNLYKYTTADDPIVSYDNTTGVPYNCRWTLDAMPEVLTRLWEVTVDHFYMHRGAILTGTIATSIPNTLEFLIDNVLDMTPFQAGDGIIMFDSEQYDQFNKTTAPQT